jgi:hypothetical protein
MSPSRESTTTILGVALGGEATEAPCDQKTDTINRPRPVT